MIQTNSGKVIEKWVKAHKGKPAKVKGTNDLLRIRFDELDKDLEIITWFEFFRIFEESELSFLCEEGDESRFCKFVSRTVEND